MNMAFPQNEKIFSGHLSKFEQKEGDGKELYKGRQGFEFYTGSFKRDAYNGHANYFANSIKRGLWAYQGDFRSNIIEGYGAISYGDATYFSGLFKNDKPFGPGILTHTNGRQDVGIWYGSQIYRLCITVCRIEKLTYTPQDRIQVAKFKKLVEIDEPLIDIVPALLKSIGGKAGRRFDPSVLYSRFCKNPSSNLYDHKYFDLDDLEEIEMSLSAENPKAEQGYSHTLATKFINTSKVELKDVKSDSEVESDDDYSHDSNAPSKSMLRGGSEEVFVLSWNNTSNVIELMKHSFKHRRQEETSDFNIVNILCGRRKKFRTRGPKENASIKVLEASASNNVMAILKELKQHTLSLDVMDNKGNSMIITAAANDAHDVMQLLHFLGADIDTVNDEGFSALTHTLTRYIALKYDVSNWSSGFLPKNRYGEEYEEEEKWFNECMQSNYSLNGGSVSSSQAQGSIPKVKKNKKSSMPQNSRSVTVKEPPRSPRSEYVFELSPEPRYFNSRSDAIAPEAFEKDKRLEVIKETAFYLLDIGVDLHVSSTPAPIMVLAIFSGNLLIVEKLLERGADPNEMHEMNNGELSALHIIAQARPLPSYPAMVNMFLRYGANPNLRTSVNYNSIEWNYLLEWVKLSQPVVPGLTPLHIIAMRSDATYVTNKQYLEQICCLLSWFGDHNELFLGLSPLGLAISKGNNNIVSTILNCAKIDVNAPINHFWVNPLFTYLRCHGYKDDPATLDILRTLILKGANPLETGMKDQGAGNALNFIIMMRVRRSSNLDELKLSKDNNLKYHEEILLELAKLNVRKYIRGLLVRLHLKFLKGMEAEIMNFMKNLHSPAALRQLYLPLLPKLISFPTSIKYSDIDDEEEEVEYGYKEICERTKDWMNTDKECMKIMEKTLQKAGEVHGSGQALQLTALLPNMSIRPKRPELKNLKITKFLEGKCLPDLRTCPIIKNKPKESIKNEEDKHHEENLKWIKHFVNQYKSDVYVYPELDKNRSKYIVCYKCLKRTAHAQSCPVCRLVYFCSMKCNLADSNRPDQYHRCAVVYWNMKQRQFFALEKKHSFLKSKKSTLLSRKSRISIFTISSSTSPKDSAASDGSSRSSSSRGEESAEMEEKWTIRARKQKKALSELIKLPKKRSNRKYQKKSKIRFRGREKYKRMSKLKDRRLLGLATKMVSDEGDEVDMFGLSERDWKWDKINTKARAEVAARLLERQSYILESLRLEAERLKEEHDIDTELLGEVASPEEFWEKADQNVEGKQLKDHSLKNRFMAFLKMLQDKFEGFDLEKYLPYIVFVDGVMYYKFYGTKGKYRENYSFN